MALYTQSLLIGKAMLPKLPFPQCLNPNCVKKHVYTLYWQDRLARHLGKWTKCTFKKINKAALTLVVTSLMRTIACLDYSCHMQSKQRNIKCGFSFT